MTIDEFFAGREESRALFEAVKSAIEAIGPVEVRVGRSQVSFFRRVALARVWIPGRYLVGRKTAPLVLTLGFRRRDPSPRWKEIVEPKPGWFTHHLELYSARDVDDDVRGWLTEAWAAAG